MDKNTANVSFAAAICCAVIAFVILIWPTPYIYMKVTRPVYRGLGYQESDQVWRINRLTGSAVAVEATVAE
jgi:hypothetical protein